MIATISKQLNHLIQNIRHKRGSYIVEGAITLPVFILCLCALAMIINIIAICENIGFIVAREVKELDLNVIASKELSLVKRVSLCNDVLDENKALSNFKIKDYDILFNDNGIDDLIYIETKAVFSVNSSTGIHGKIEFKEGLLTRGFTGRLLDSKGLPQSAFESEGQKGNVIVFPKYGERYHDQGCRYVKQNYEGEEIRVEMQAEDAVRKGYSPCKVCRGGS